MSDHVSPLLPTIVTLLAVTMPLSSGSSGFENVYKFPGGEQGKEQEQGQDPYRCDIFVSYCKEDRKYWEQIDKFLYDVHQDGYKFYSYRTIEAGAEIMQQTSSALLTSSVAVLLMSQDYIASGLMKSEFLGILDEAERRGKYILWLQTRQFRSKHAERLKKYQKVGDVDSLPLNQLSGPKRDAIYMDLADTVIKRLSKLQELLESVI